MGTGGPKGFVKMFKNHLNCIQRPIVRGPETALVRPEENKQNKRRSNQDGDTPSQGKGKTRKTPKNKQRKKGSQPERKTGPVTIFACGRTQIFMRLPLLWNEISGRREARNHQEREAGKASRSVPGKGRTCPGLCPIVEI